MKKFNITIDRSKVENYHRIIQGIISLLGNEQFNRKEVKAARTAQGGVVVNNRELLIGHDFVIDTLIRSDTPTNEENVVAEIIEKLFQAINLIDIETSLRVFVEQNSNIPEEERNELLCGFLNNPFSGDSMISFFNVLNKICVEKEPIEFKSFFFNTNLYFATVNSVEVWKKILATFKKEWRDDGDAEKIMSMCRATTETKEIESGNEERRDNYMPNFGLYQEHTSSLTLKDWAQANGMYDLLLV